MLAIIEFSVLLLFIFCIFLLKGTGSKKSNLLWVHVKIVLSSLKLEVKSNKCENGWFSFLNYTIMLGYSQWLTIKGKNYFIETLITVMLAFNHKK